MRDDGSSKYELRKIKGSMALPFLFISICLAFKIIEATGDFTFYYLGIYPRHINGLQGILLAPFIHGDWAHLWANGVSFFVLASTLIYFYKDASLPAFMGVYIFSGVFVWLLGRESWHIGASGIVYGLGSFLFFSGLIRNNIPLMAVSLFIVFMYGSMVWGMFPININLPYSWESHLGGALGGVLLALLLRKSGPVRVEHQWEDENEDVEQERDTSLNAEKGNDEIEKSN